MPLILIAAAASLTQPSMRSFTPIAMLLAAAGTTYGSGAFPTASGSVSMPPKMPQCWDQCFGQFNVSGTPEMLCSPKISGFIDQCITVSCEVAGDSAAATRKAPYERAMQRDILIRCKNTHHGCTVSAVATILSQAVAASSTLLRLRHHPPPSLHPPHLLLPPRPLRPRHPSTVTRPPPSSLALADTFPSLLPVRGHPAIHLCQAAGKAASASPTSPTRKRSASNTQAQK